VIYFKFTKILLGINYFDKIGIKHYNERVLKEVFQAEYEKLFEKISNQLNDLERIQNFLGLEEKYSLKHSYLECVDHLTKEIENIEKNTLDQLNVLWGIKKFSSIDKIEQQHFNEFFNCYYAFISFNNKKKESNRNNSQMLLTLFFNSFSTPISSIILLMSFKLSTDFTN
jgi:hypothetical protein